MPMTEELDVDENVDLEENVDVHNTIARKSWIDKALPLVLDKTFVLT